MKSIWTGSIGFGLVNIPIKLYSAIENGRLDFDMLDKKDKANIKFKRVNENTGKEVEWANIVKGYMMDSKYVIVDEDDFKKASPEKSSHIEIIQFVKVEEIDPVYYESPYFVQPDKSGVRAYQLLKEALAKTDKAGLGTFVMREREHVCLIKPYENILLLSRLRFADEVRDTKELSAPQTKAKPAEVKMAISLIDQLTKPFKPEAFKDDYSEKLMKIIKAKAKNKSVAYKPMKVVHTTKTSDLMDQLKASLGGRKKKAS